MILTFLHDIFAVTKIFFGLGALVGLLGIGLLSVWFVLRALVIRILRGQPINRYLPLRKLFLEI